MDDMIMWNASAAAPIEEDEVSFDDLCEAYEDERWIQSLLDEALKIEPVDLDEEWFQDMLCDCAPPEEWASCASSASSEPPML